MYHDAKLHKSSVDLSTACVDDIDIILSHRLDNANACLADPTLGHFRFPKWQTEAARRNE